MQICIVGAGAWGTAVALYFLRKGHGVTLLSRRFTHAMNLSSQRENQAYLPGHSLPYDLQIAHQPGPALMEADVVCFACPSFGLRDWCHSLKPAMAAAWRLRFLVSLVKGLEEKSHALPSQILREELPGYLYGCLTGPTHADEVASGRPTAMVLAGQNDTDQWRSLQEEWNGAALRIYLSNDLTGAELGGCLKNVYAIGAGVCDGLRAGDNAKAALLTRILSEMVRVGTSLGAKTETFYGLSGVGDLLATAYGTWSRNRTFGQELAQKRCPPHQLLEERRTVVEGYRTTRAVLQWCREKSVEAPVLEEIHAILYEQKPIEAALQDLMNRSPKEE